MIPLEEAQTQIPGEVELTENDYLLGLFDLVGELMRFAVTGMATNGALPRTLSQEGDEGGREGRDILTDLRSLRTHFEALDTTSSRAPEVFNPLKKDMEKKTKVMKTCVEKVEKAVYGMIIRGRERPKGWIPDMAEEGGGPRELVESY